MNPIIEENKYLHNSWRGLLYTSRGKTSGVDTRWRNFYNFLEDVKPTYIEGYRLCRKDKTKQYGPDNFVWLSDDDLAEKRTTIYLTYDGYTKSLKQWAKEYGMNYNGLRQRYVRGKNYTVEEILFGKKIRTRNNSREYNLKTRASKLLSSYRLRDWKHNMEFDLDKDWFIKNILNKPCIYCGSTNKIGADRIDNSKGHIKDNVVPCCYVCNVTRGNNFTFDEMCILGQAIKNIYKERNNNTN